MSRASALALALAALAALAAAAMAAAPGPARAQDLRGFALQTYEPAPAGDGFLAVPGTGAPGHQVPAVALVLSWAREPLVLEQGGATIPGGRLVHRQVWGFLQGAVGLGERVLLDATLPVALYQSGSQYYASVPSVSTAALGDLKLGLRTPLPRLGPVALAAGLELWLPTGNADAFASDGKVRLRPQAIAGGAAGPIEWGASAGVLYRPSSDRGFTRVGTAVAWSAAAAWALGPWRVGPELYGRYQFEGTTTSPAEALLAGHWRRGAIDAGLAVGTSFDRAPGAAPLRVLARVAWRPPQVDPAAEAARREAELRAAQLEAERLEAARLEAERRAAEEAAAARAAAEREEAARRAALAEAAQRAEAERLAAERAGADRDGDGIPDAADACPGAPGPASDAPDRNGCPAPPPTLVRLTQEKIEILQAVRFETGSDVIRPESEALLREVAQVLVEHPGIARVVVEGHTDGTGARAHNLALSAARARAVERWLIVHGVAPERLSAEGFGPDRPIAPEDAPEGRARNRRVEFRIVERR